MTTASVSRDAARLAELIHSASNAVVLTGAGISVPSGIPDFRTPGKGLWGTPTCGKGEPIQIIGTGHGASPGRFRNVRVGVFR